MKILMIADTQGSAISDAYRELVPGVEFRGVEPDALRGQDCLAHGAQCGWLAARALAEAEDDWRVLFVRLMDKAGKFIAGWEDFLLDQIALHEPAIVSRSWGAWDGDTQLGGVMARLTTERFAEAYAPLKRELGFLDFAAAGNNDENDRDPDIVYPQAALDFSHIIGSHRRCGVADGWSADGSGMECCMWGSGIQAPDQFARFFIVFGTSETAPKAAGVCGAYGLDDAGWLALVQATAVQPSGDWDLPHPKWGWGSMEHHWQHLALKSRLGGV